LDADGAVDARAAFGYNASMASPREPEAAALAAEVEALKAERKATADLLDFVAHELMTPVTSLEAFSFILQRDTPLKEDPTGRRCLDGISRNAARLVALVDELLEIGRLRSGRIELAAGRFDARELARPEVARATLDPGAPELDVAAGAEPLPVRADRPRLEQLVAELVRDAAARAPRGSRVALSLAVAAPGRVRLEARDAGTAVAAEKLARAFEGLRRTADGLPAGERGGLGLALGREAVLRAGGTTGASSGADGNRVWIELPIAAP
jgi:signal transduction histidine kinase